MKVAELAERLKLTAAVSGDLEKEVSGCYIGDLMSLAMAKLEENNVWITIQTNLNVVAVAALKEAGCVILADGCVPDANAAAKAETEEIPILLSEDSAYTLALRLGVLGI